MDAKSLASQRDNETSWCLLLVNRLLPLLLPPEDLHNPCLDVLVSEVLAELIFRNGICGKAAESWLLWDGITKLLRSSQARHQSPSKGSSSRNERLQRYDLLDAPVSEVDIGQGSDRKRFNVSQTLWFAVQCVITAWLFLRMSLTALVQASSIPSRTSRASHQTKTARPQSFGPDRSPSQVESVAHDAATRPIISMHIWGCMSTVLSLEQRMPWLSGFLSFMQWMSLRGPGRLCDTDSRLDR